MGFKLYRKPLPIRRSGDLRLLFDAANQLDVRESRLKLCILCIFGRFAGREFPAVDSVGKIPVVMLFMAPCAGTVLGLAKQKSDHQHGGEIPVSRRRIHLTAVSAGNVYDLLQAPRETHGGGKVHALEASGLLTG